MRLIIFLILCFLSSYICPAQYAVHSENTFLPPANNYEIKNLEGLNSPYLDYSAVPYKDGVVFTSGRGKGGVFVCDQALANGGYSDLFFAKKDKEGNYFNPEILHGELNGKYHDGTATFATEGEKMFFSRNNTKGPNGNGLIDLKIYEADRNKNNWVNAQELPFNSDEFGTCHPALSADGMLLFFASNRPGGYGGMDIYVAKKQVDGWSTSINLGPEVNTPGNEVFPFMAKDKVLYFASNGHPGMGGLDVFSVQMDGVGPAMRQHLPSPVNSSEDDFAYTENMDGRSGFLSSNRAGGKGGDDIYGWKFNGVKPSIANICVINNETNERIEDARLTIVPVSAPTLADLAPMQLEAVEINGKSYLVLKNHTSNAGITLSSNKSCAVKFPATPGETYIIKVEKEGLATTEVNVTFAELTATPEYRVRVGPGTSPVALHPNHKPVTYDGLVRDRLNGKALPLATVKVLNKCTNEKTEYTADHRGVFQLELDCQCEYDIVALENGYEIDHKSLISNDIPCDNKFVSGTFDLTPDGIEPSKRVAATNKDKFSVGNVIRLEKVYYDYRESYIRPDAAIELDYVVRLMQAYPSMEIELGSHTDARSSSEFNVTLSQKRAEEAKKYLISRGIVTSRITAKGYGESEPENNCVDGVDCSEQEHQENRRTEIRITKLNEPGVRVED